MTYVYVITNPELGWDCVMGVYQASSEEAVKKRFFKELGYDEIPEDWDNTYVIHKERLEIIE